MEQDPPLQPEKEPAKKKAPVPSPPVITQRERKKTAVGFWPKTLKDYFFEFFMLFLAITLGFFVENKREDLSDKKKVRQYMRSYIQDLKEDTLEINYIYGSNTWQLNGLDSLISLLYQHSSKDSQTMSELYRLYRLYARNTWTVNFSDRTMTQLKNSGNLRLVRQDISDSMMRYEEWVNYTRSQERLYKNDAHKALDLSTEIFNYKFLRYNPSSNDYNLASSVTLMTTDTNKLIRYANELELLKQIIYQYNYNYLAPMKYKAVYLLNYLKEEYDL